MSEPTDDPDALPEAPPWVAELLGSLRADDPPTPDTVVARLDATLAELAASRSAGGSTAAGPPAGPPDTVEDATSGASASGAATVVPMQAGTRHRSERAASRSPLGWIGGLAAAALVVVGGVAVVHNTSNGSSSPALATDGNNPGTLAAIQPKYVASGIGYTAAALTSQVRTLLTSAGVDAASPSPRVATAPPTSPETLKTATGTPSKDCLSGLAPTPAAQPLVVDEATYTGTKIYLVVYRSSDEPTSVDIWVVKRTCTSADAGLVKYVRIPD